MDELRVDSFLKIKESWCSFDPFSELTVKLNYDQTELVADLGLELALLVPIPGLFVHMTVLPVTITSRQSQVL